jgi:CubicO group peptidase (beta-lactamase class C family)
MRFASVLALLLALSLSASAQQAITPNQARAGTLAADGADAYTLDLDAGTFVAGTAFQETADVVVTVTGPDGAEVAQFDETARGDDLFQFEAEAAGAYTLTVTPFEEEAGAYVLTVERAEPIATAPEGRVDQIFALRDRDGAPGALVAVVDGGEVIYRNAYGTANLTHGVPMTVETRSNIGSTSKQFTAFALLLLEQRGALDLDDDVREYVPELPDFGETVTLRHLLTHTSGYREFLNALVVGGRRLDEGDFVDRAEILALIQRQPELQNTPGTEWNYNNSGYGLAALVVERVTGRPFPEWMAENVFRPMGMTETAVRASPSTLVPNSAQGYVASDDGWKDARDLGGAVGAGSIYTTLDDLARWMGHYWTPTLGGQEAVDQMTTRYVLADGDTTDYGLGLFVEKMGSVTRIHHGGADAAHRSSFAFVPELDFGVIVLTNSPADVDALAGRVAEAFFGDRIPDGSDEPAAEADGPEAVDFDDALFDDYAGEYALDVAPDFVLAFRRDGEGGYVTQATGQPAAPIVPVSDSTFAVTVVDASVTFRRDADGVVRSATLHQNGDHRATKLGVEPLEEAEPLDLEAYAGQYVSPTLEAFRTVEVVDGELRASSLRFPEGQALRHTTGDTFMAGGFAVEFERDASGAVTAFVVDAGRARDLRFERFE